MALRETLRSWARRLKRDSLTLWFAYRCPGTPLLARLLCALVVAYALSPIDLIPDFVPVLGYLDDAILLPALIWLAVRMLPPEVVASSRLEADRWMREQATKPRSLLGAALIIALWLVALALCWHWLTGS